MRESPIAKIIDNKQQILSLKRHMPPIVTVGTSSRTFYNLIQVGLHALSCSPFLYAPLAWVASKSALVWNYLPDDLKSCTTIADFRVKLAIWVKDSLTLIHCCDLLSSNVHNQ